MVKENIEYCDSIYNTIFLSEEELQLLFNKGELDEKYIMSLEEYIDNSYQYFHDEIDIFPHHLHPHISVNYLQYNFKKDPHYKNDYQGEIEDLFPDNNFMFEIYFEKTSGLNKKEEEEILEYFKMIENLIILRKLERGMYD